MIRQKRGNYQGGNRPIFSYLKEGMEVQPLCRGIANPALDIPDGVVDVEPIDQKGDPIGGHGGLEGQKKEKPVGSQPNGAREAGRFPGMIYVKSYE
jgi:hypothetical protein